MKYLKVNIAISFLLLLLLNSCNKHFTKFPTFGKNKKIPSIDSLPAIIEIPNKPLKIISISMLNRQTDKGGYSWIPKVVVSTADGDKNFNLILKYIDSIQLSQIFLINYYGSRLNDSIYKPVFDINFRTNYSHLQMQQIDFSYLKSNGVYLIVTYILQSTGGMGGGIGPGGGAGTGSNTLYEFFQVQNGKAVAYSGFSLGRNDSFRNVSQKGFPKYRDVKKVFEMLYEQSAKASKGKDR